MNATDAIVEQVLMESGLLDQMTEKKAARAAAERAALFDRAAELEAVVAEKLPALEDAVKSAERRHQNAVAELSAATQALQQAGAARHSFVYGAEHQHDRVLGLAAQIGDPRITAAQASLVGMRQKILARASMSRETKTDFLGHKSFIDVMTNHWEVEAALAELLNAARSLEALQRMPATDAEISQILAPLAAALADLGIDFTF